MTQDEVVVSIAQAEEQYGRQDYQAVLDTVEPILRDHASHAHALHLASACLVALGRYEEAVPKVLNLVVVESNNVETRYLAGVTLMKVQRYRDAIEHLDAVRTLRTDYRDTRELLGECLLLYAKSLEGTQLKTAEAQLWRAMEVAPERPEPVFEMLKVFKLENNMEDAAHFIEKLKPEFRSNPKIAEALAVLEQDPKVKSILHPEPDLSALGHRPIPPPGSQAAEAQKRLEKSREEPSPLPVAFAAFTLLAGAATAVIGFIVMKPGDSGSGGSPMGGILIGIGAIQAIFALVMMARKD